MQFSSMMNKSGVSGKGEQEIKKHLKAHLETGFCSSRRCVGMLFEGRGVVNYGCFILQEEFIEWSEKRIDDKIARYLQCHLQSR